LRHQRPIRSTNLLERASQESRRRTKVILRFLTEWAWLKLVFSVPWKTSQRWRAVTTTELERQQLAVLRKELGLPLYPGQETHVHR
jgi:transposase-like protein